MRDKNRLLVMKPCGIGVKHKVINDIDIDGVHKFLNTENGLRIEYFVFWNETIVIRNDLGELNKKSLLLFTIIIMGSIPTIHE